MKKGKIKISKYRFLIVLVIYIGTSMWIYGMTQIYFVDSIVSIGAGQYLDLGIGVIFLFLFGVGVILLLLFSKDMRKFKTMKI